MREPNYVRLKTYWIDSEYKYRRRRNNVYTVATVLSVPLTQLSNHYCLVFSIVDKCSCKWHNVFCYMVCRCALYVSRVYLCSGSIQSTNMLLRLKWQNTPDVNNTIQLYYRQSIYVYLVSPCRKWTTQSHICDLHFQICSHYIWLRIRDKKCDVQQKLGDTPQERKCFRPPFCTLLRLNWTEQAQGTVRWINDETCPWVDSN